MYMCSLVYVYMYRESLKLPDGGELMLYWMDNNRSRRFPRHATRPTVLLMPGATGTPRHATPRYAHPSNSMIPHVYESYDT